MSKDYRHGENRWRKPRREDSEFKERRWEKPPQRERYDRDRRNEWKRKLEF